MNETATKASVSLSRDSLPAALLHRKHKVHVSQPSATLATQLVRMTQSLLRLLRLLRSCLCSLEIHSRSQSVTRPRDHATPESRRDAGMGDPRTAVTAATSESESDSRPDKDSKLWRSAKEVLSPDVATVVGGPLPGWLAGSYLRVGPGKFDLGDDGFVMTSWLDGFAIASKFAIDPDAGTVAFEARYLESQAYRGATKHGRPILPEYGTKKYAESGKGFFSNFLSNLVPEMSDNPTTAYLPYDPSHSTLFVGGESCYFHHIDPDTLRLGERFDSKELFGFLTCSLHPLRDTADGAIYNVGTSILTGVKYNVFRVGPFPAGGEAIGKEALRKTFKVLATVPSRWTTAMAGIHSFGQTSKHVVLVEQPYVGNVKRVLGNAVKGRAEPMAASLEWHPDACNRFYLVAKADGEVLQRVFEFLSSAPFFFIHVVNCYEEVCRSTKQSFVVVDVSCFETPDSISAQTLQQLRASEFGCNNCVSDHALLPWVQRFILPLSLDGKRTPEGVDLLSLQLEAAQVGCASNEPSPIDGSVATAVRRGKQILLTPKTLMRRGLELPVINPAFSGRPYQFYYGSGLVSQTGFRNSVAKVDVRACEATIFRESPDFIFGEALFVPRPRAEGGEGAEDDGAVIVPMTDARKEAPDMLFFLDAKDMTEIGRVVFRERVPPSIHGTFVPAAK